jgi:hypothetical protein
MEKQMVMRPSDRELIALQEKIIAKQELFLKTPPGKQGAIVMKKIKELNDLKCH